VWWAPGSAGGRKYLVEKSVFRPCSCACPSSTISMPLDPSIVSMPIRAAEGRALPSLKFLATGSGEESLPRFSESLLDEENSVASRVAEKQRAIAAW
jgi:hypothetical protein